MEQRLATLSMAQQMPTNIRADEGDDTVFAGDNPVDPCAFPSVLDKELNGPFVFGVTRCVPQGLADELNGAGGNDFLSGGPGQDFLHGDAGNDHLLAGPDVPNFGQVVHGGTGNDVAYVFVGEIVSCLIIYGESGFDIVNLIGFGPFSASQSFGITPGWVNGWLVVNDPIGGGVIYIQVFENGDAGTEVINGLTMPSVTFIDTLTLNGCNVPCKACLLINLAR